MISIHYTILYAPVKVIKGKITIFIFSLMLEFDHHFLLTYFKSYSDYNLGYEKRQITSLSILSDSQITFFLSFNYHSLINNAIN